MYETRTDQNLRTLLIAQLKTGELTPEQAEAVYRLYADAAPRMPAVTALNAAAYWREQTARHPFPVALEAWRALLSGIAASAQAPRGPRGGGQVVFQDGGAGNGGNGNGPVKPGGGGRRFPQGRLGRTCVETISWDWHGWVLLVGELKQTVKLPATEPLPLVVGAYGSHSLKSECVCVQDELKPLGPKVQGKYPVLASPTYEWRILGQGKGRFVDRAGGGRGAIDLNAVLYEPPDLTAGENVSVAIEVRVGHRKGAAVPEPRKHGDAVVSYKVRVTAFEKQEPLGEISTELGSGHDKDDMCVQPGAVARAIRLVDTRRLVPRGLRVDSKRGKMPISQHRLYYRYEVQKTVAGKRGRPPLPDSDAGTCVPRIELERPQQPTIFLSSTASQDLSTVDTILLTAAVSGEVQLSHQCTSDFCRDTPLVPITLLDTYMYEWRASRGKFVGGNGGATVAWTVDRPLDRSPVKFWVDVYSVISLTKKLVGSKLLTVVPRPVWKKRQAGYIGFVDEEKRHDDKMRPTDMVPCRGADKFVTWPGGKRRCVKRGPVIDYAAYSYGGSKKYTGYVYPEPGWETVQWGQYGIPRSQYLARRPIFNAAWDRGRMGTHHPWFFALQALIWSANPRPRDGWRSTEALRAGMNESKEYRHMAGARLNLLVRRGSIVAVAPLTVFCELGWTPNRMFTNRTWRALMTPFLHFVGWFEFGKWLELFSIGERDPRFGDHPEVSIRVSPQSVTFHTKDRFRLGALGNRLGRLMTNRNAPWSDLSFRAVMTAERQAPVVEARSSIQYPTVFLYSGSSSLQKRGEAPQKLSVATILDGTKCLDKSRFGL